MSPLTWWSLVIPAAMPVAIKAQYIAVAGTVVDSGGVPVAGAELRLSTASATSGGRGEFRLVVSDRGRVMLHARRLGFRADSVPLDLRSGNIAGLTVALRPVGAMLKPMVVRADRVRHTGRLAGYYERLERRTSGYFITRDQINRENPRTLSQLLVHVPGVTAFRGRGGLQSVRMRGRNCPPLLWVDGIPMSAAEVDLDAFPPSTIHGIELYTGSTSAPIRYSQARSLSSCGTILVWSRGVDTDPIVRRPYAARVENRTGVDRALLADQVDVPSQSDPGHPVKVDYPPSLFAERIAGTVLAEFVVDVDGTIDRESFGIIFSPHELFSEAVRIAVERSRFRPATLAGKPVRQLVQQSFTFLHSGRTVAGGK